MTFARLKVMGTYSHYNLRTHKTSNNIIRDIMNDLQYIANNLRNSKNTALGPYPIQRLFTT